MTTTRLVRTLMCFAIATSAVHVSAQSSPWAATVAVEPSEALLGSVVYAKIGVRNVSDQPVTVPAPFSHCGHYCRLWVTSPPTDGEEKCTYGLGCWASYWLPVYTSKMEVAPGEVVTDQTYSIQVRCAGSYRVAFRCDVPSSVTEPEVNSKTGEPVSNDEVWHGSFSSNEATFQAVEPKGLDAEVYEAFRHSPIDCMESERQRLLETYPTSTYAADLVYRMSWPGLRPHTVEDAVREMKAKGRGFPSTALPCTKTIASACRDVGVGPRGREAARRNVAWIEFVLQHHPTIQFADQLRFIQAYATYFTGKEADCAARLQTLSKTASPEVATRAHDLLEAMRAEGLFEQPPETQGDDQ